MEKEDRWKRGAQMTDSHSYPVSADAEPYDPVKVIAALRVGHHLLGPTERESAAAELLEGYLARGVAQASPEVVTDDELFALAAAAWETQTIHPWYTDALEAAVYAVRERLTPPVSSTDRVTLPGHDETMANLDALTISATEGK